MAETGTHIRGFSLDVRDLDRAAHFYIGGLGLREIATEEHADFKEVIVGGDGDSAPILLVKQLTQQDTTAPGSTKILLVSDDVEALHQRAVDHGASSLQPPVEVPEAGVCFASVRDLDGYTLQLIEYRKAPATSP